MYFSKMFFKSKMKILENVPETLFGFYKVLDAVINPLMPGDNKKVTHT